MKLEAIMLGEIRQPQKDKDCMISLIYVESEKTELIERERRTVVARGWG